MSNHFTCCRSFKVTLVTFTCTFTHAFLQITSCVDFKAMLVTFNFTFLRVSPQITCHKGFKVAVVTFEFICFMSTQITSRRTFKVTWSHLRVFVFTIVPRVQFKVTLAWLLFVCLLKLPVLQDLKSQCSHLIWFFLCQLKLLVVEHSKSHWSHCHIWLFRRYYENDQDRLGQPLPKPKIKHTKKVGDEIFHKLAWGDEKGGEWIEEDLFEALIAEGETSTTTCNTRKSRDKRERKHTVGVFIGAFPCGVIVIGEELHISESIKQVYSHLSEALKNMKDFSNIRQIFYDDMCHLKRFAEKPEQANKNEITKKLAEVSKHVDKFHFREAVKKTVLFRNNS